MNTESATAHSVEIADAPPAEIVSSPPDRFGQDVDRVLAALHLSIAPVADSADAALRRLLASLPDAGAVTVRQWITALAYRELLDARALSIWPHPAGTRVKGPTFESRTTSEARSLPDRTVVVDVVGMVGAVSVDVLTVLE